MDRTMELDAGRLVDLYATMLRIRRFEETTRELFLAGRVKGTAHSYVGQETTRPGPAPPCARTTSSSVITAGTGIAWPRARGPNA